MRFALLAAVTLAAATAPAAAQTLSIAQSTDASEVGPFGDGTVTLLGQSFVAQAARLQTFTFYLRNDPGVVAAPTFRAYVAGYDPISGAIGSVLFTSGLLTGAPGSAYTPLPVTANVGLVNGQAYIAYLGGVTSSLGVNYFAANSGAPYAGGVLVYDFGGGPQADPTMDLAFTAVFAPAATAVPEPATLALVASGLVGAGLLARRRRAA